MATLELGLFPLTQLKGSQEEHHHLLYHHPHQHQKKKQKMMTMVSHIRPSDKDLVAATNGGGDDSWEVRAFAEDTNNIMGSTWPPRFYTCSFCRRDFRSAQALGGHMNVHRRDRARAQMLPRLAPPPVIFTEAVAGSGSGFCFVYPVVARSDRPVDQAWPSTKDSSSSTLLSSSHNNVGTTSFGATEDDENEEELMVKEVDLELRLGW